jgi:hypothetical protein
MSAPTLPAISSTGSPYKGLDYYGEQDAPFFSAGKSTATLWSLTCSQVG